MNAKKIIQVINVSLIIIIISAISILASPQPFHGYAFYMDSNSAVNATVDVLNLNNSEHIYTTVLDDGYYIFDVGDPGPNWKNGEILLVTITQEKNEIYSGWTGNISITINKDLFHQQIPNITLNPSSLLKLPPLQPIQLTGTTVGYTNESYHYITVTTDPNGDPIYYLFDWGNNATSTWLGLYKSGDICVGMYSWKHEGIYNIKVKAKDGNNYESSWSPALTIEIKNQTQTSENQTENFSPTAIFTYSPDLPNIQETIQFTDFSIDKDGNITEWFCDFGDGSATTQQYPTHQYTNNRKYIVTLTVWDDNGLINTTYKQIMISNESETEVPSENSNGDGTPGFSLIAIIFGLILILFYRNKKS